MHSWGGVMLPHLLDLCVCVCCHAVPLFNSSFKRLLKQSKFCCFILATTMNHTIAGCVHIWLMAIRTLMPIQPAMIVNKGNMNSSGQPMTSDSVTHIPTSGSEMIPYSTHILSLCFHQFVVKGCRHLKELLVYCYCNDISTALALTGLGCTLHVVVCGILAALKLICRYYLLYHKV